MNVLGFFATSWTPRRMLSLSWFRGFLFWPFTMSKDADVFAVTGFSLADEVLSWASLDCLVEDPGAAFRFGARAPIALPSFPLVY